MGAVRGWRKGVKALLALVLLVWAIWGGLGIFFQVSGIYRHIFLIIWSILGLMAIASLWGRVRWVRLGPFALATLVWAVWWGSMAPTHQRNWAPDVAQLLRAEQHGNRLVLHNVRNFAWAEDGSGTHTPRWETREYDLSQLQSADLLLSYWMGPHIAHTLVSYGFADGRQLVFSLEIRKERHEAFSAVAGFFRQYEAVLIAADENDIVRTRTNARGETVQLYRLALGAKELRDSLLGYVARAESIAKQPEFYNTLTSNCTTIVFELARQLVPGLPLDWRLLASGHFAEYAFDHEGLVPGHSYAELQEKGDITVRAREFAGTPAEFPVAIRQGVPGWQGP